jgi:outer membrane PBP1 activator LpoA protein
MPTRTKNHRHSTEGGQDGARGAWINGVLALLILLVLTACSSTGSSWTPEPAKSQSGEAALARGEYEQAARSWQQEALDAGPQRAGSLRVRAADAWLLAGKPGSAEDALRWVDREDLAPPDESRLDLVLADLALRNHRPDEAELLLRKAQPELPSGAKKRYDNLQARVIAQLSSPGSRGISGAAKLSEKMRFYDPAESVELIRSLERVSTGELAIRAENPRGERQLTGWLDLALVIRQYLVVPKGVTTAMDDWKSRHPFHLLTGQQALDTWLRYRQLFSPPRKVAVLLPESGRLKAAGEAIRDGVMSAYMDSPGGAEVLFFTTGEDEQSAISAYFNALDAGVDWIIGPLRIESVEAMLNLAGMSTPVLALNDLPDGFIAPPGLAGQVSAISLSQNRETAAIGAQAAGAGFENAIVMAPEDPWGERMVIAFESEFLHENRKIIAAARYLDTQNDHSAALERLLKIDESKARMKRLQNTLQMTLEFEPVRRHDFDVIFLAATATQARLIRPQLRFHDAGDVPVYATARIYSGQPDPARNQDLNGVRFPAAPWQLMHSSKADIPDLTSIRGGNLGSLFALGQDAWNMLPWLALMQKDPDFTFPGQSGFYRSANKDTLHREPAWAEFVRGRPVPLRDPVPAGAQ